MDSDGGGPSHETCCYRPPTEWWSWLARQTVWGNCPGLRGSCKCKWSAAGMGLMGSDGTSSAGEGVRKWGWKRRNTTMQSTMKSLRFTWKWGAIGSSEQRSRGFGRDHMYTTNQPLRLLLRQQTLGRQEQRQGERGGGTAICHVSDQVARPAVLAWEMVRRGHILGVSAYLEWEESERKNSTYCMIPFISNSRNCKPIYSNGRLFGDWQERRGGTTKEHDRFKGWWVCQLPWLWWWSCPVGVYLCQNLPDCTL